MNRRSLPLARASPLASQDPKATLGVGPWPSDPRGVAPKDAWRSVQTRPRRSMPELEAELELLELFEGAPNI